MQGLRIQIRTRGLRATPAERAHTEREVRRALGRGGRPAGDVVAFLSDLNGPRGGEDKRCQIRACLESAGDVFASAESADLQTAVVKAARRLGRAASHAAARHGDRGRAATREAQA